MTQEPVDREEFNLVADWLGSRILAAEPIGWGDARATHRLSLSDGRRFAARWFVGPETRQRVGRIAGVMTGLARAGLPVPSPTVVETDRGSSLLTAWVDGETGASWLDEPERARHLADRMGRLAVRLRAVDTSDLGLHARVAEDPSAVDALTRVSFIHGDFAPVNVVLDADGEIAALLDFEHAGLGPALLDVAWWGWVVRHHHPEPWASSWPTFLRAAGLEPDLVEAPLHELALRTLADRAAAAADAEARGRWLERLSAARAWRLPGDQAT